MRKIGFKRKEEEHSQSWCSICKEPLLLSPKKHAIGNQKTLLYHILRDDEKSGVGSHVGPDELSGMEPAEDRFDLKWRRGKRAGTYWCP